MMKLINVNHKTSRLIKDICMTLILLSSLFGTVISTYASAAENTATQPKYIQGDK